MVTYFFSGVSIISRCALIVIFLFCVACTKNDAPFEITHVLVREMPPGMSVSSAYLVIRNHSKAALFLNGVHSKITDRIEIHRSVYDQGKMLMREVQHLSIEPRQTLEFTPGGYHLMLMGIEKRLIAGDTLELVFDFQGYPSARIVANVKRF